MTNWASGNISPSMPMNGIDPPSPNARDSLPKLAADASSSASCSHVGECRSVPTRSGVAVVERHVGAVRRIGGQRRGDRGERRLVIARRWQADAEMQRGVRAQHVARRLDGWDAVDTGHAECRVPRACEQLLGGIGDHRLGSGDEREVAADREVGRSRRGLLPTVRRDLDVQFGAAACVPSKLSSIRSSSSRQMRNDDGTTPLASPECTPSVRISTRSVPADQTAQRRGDPQPLVVEAAGVETQHQARRADLRRRVPRGRRAGPGCRSPRWPRSARRSGCGSCPLACAASIASTEANAA